MKRVDIPNQKDKKIQLDIKLDNVSLKTLI